MIQRLIIPKPYGSACPLSGETHLGALFCLLVFLAYFLLPLHHFHLIAPKAWPAGFRGLNQLHFCNPGVPSQPIHDPATCPICQEAQNSQDFVTVDSTFGPVCPTLIQALSYDGFWLKIICSDLQVSGPRAPPISL